MKNFVRNIISIVLTQEFGNKINASLYKFRNKHKWVFRLIYGTVNDEEIFNNVLQNLDGKFDILMIHSSLNDMIPMYTGSLNKLLLIILTYCKQNNITLAMPTFFSGSNWEAKEYYENGKHIFNVGKTFSQMGMLSELFRRTPNVKRSIHPTHSICAFGPLADQLTKNHHKADTTFGEGTPFGEVLKFRTIILGIGTKSPQPLTQVNAVPDIMKSEFPITLYSDIIPVTCVDEMGINIIYHLRIRKREFMIDRKTVKKIVRSRVMEWTYKGIPFLLTQADVVTEAIIEAAKNGQTIYKYRK
jgi:hypothetical protein